MAFIPLVYDSGDQNVLINDWYACFQVQCGMHILKSAGAIT